MKPEGAVLLDLALAARRILAFTQGATRDRLGADVQLQSAVLYQIAILGEAAGRLSDEFRSRHPGVDWRNIRGMRNYIIHVYDRVDLDVVWVAVSRDMPELLRYVEPLLPPGPGPAGG